MTVFSPEFILHASGGRWTTAPSAPLTGFAVDSRRLQPGEIFVALQTAQRDGHEFLAAATAAGAPAALVAVPRRELTLAQLVVADPLAAFQAIARAHRRTFNGPVVAVTGSAGKTSTKDLLALLLGAEAGAIASPVLATAGNLNNHLGVPLTLARLDPAAHRYAVVEAGISAPGEMAALATMIEPDLVIITTVAPAHLAELGGLEGVAREKAVLAARVRPGGIALFPRACGEFAAFRELAVRTEIVDGSVYHRGEATEITFADEPSETFFLQRVSPGMASNAALAVRAAQLLGIPAHLIRRRLAQWRPAALRGEVRRTGGRLTYLDCYNANPAAMADALAAFAALVPAGIPRLYVLGCMEELGAESERYHRALGANLPLGLTDLLIMIGDQAEAIRAGARSSGGRADQLIVSGSAAEAAAVVEGFAGAVFIKGSRRYRLETLVPADPAYQGTH